jgi:hypothetical protein
LFESRTLPSGHRPLQHAGHTHLRAVGDMGLQPVSAVCQRAVRFRQGQHRRRHALHARLQQRPGDAGCALELHLCKAFGHDAPRNTWCCRPRRSRIPG